MSGPQFTRAPWFGDGRVKETGEILVYAPQGGKGGGLRDICFIPEDDEQDAANARLIAAAPELFAELQQFVNGVETGMISSPAEETLANITHRAKAALAKAQGHD